MRLDLTSFEFMELCRLRKYAPSRRVRERAETLILLNSGRTCSDVADILMINPRTVGTTRRDWNEVKFESLADKPRCGAPSILSDDDKKRIVSIAQSSPLTADGVLQEFVESGGQRVGLYIIRKILKNKGHVYKRARQSLKPKRSDDAFQKATATIEGLLTLAAKGDIEVAFLDETGFSVKHPTVYAWTEIGKVHLQDASKNGKRLNVIGALMSSGYLESTQFTGSATAATVIDFIEEFSQKYTKPMTIILDNASIHTSGKYKERIEALKKAGVSLYFLPTYSPELNRIEKVWYNMKYVWMKARGRTFPELVRDVSEILDGFGDKFKFEFYVKKL